jgi:hypothetical protein
MGTKGLDIARLELEPKWKRIELYTAFIAMQSQVSSYRLNAMESHRVASSCARYCDGIAHIACDGIASNRIELHNVVRWNRTYRMRWNRIESHRAAQRTAMESHISHAMESHRIASSCTTYCDRIAHIACDGIASSRIELLEYIYIYTIVYMICQM